MEIDKRFINSHQAACKKQHGFTLVELVIVIMLLGIVSISVSGILRGAMGAVIDVSEREDLIRQGSYLVERFNREVSTAVPNSVRVNGNATVQCVEFVPMKWNSVYLQIPLEEQASTTADLIELSDIQGRAFTPSNTDYAIVYPTRASEVYDSSLGHRRAVQSCSDDGDGDCSTLDDADQVIQIELDEGFAQNSPSKRMYFADSAISYCMRDNNVYRHESSINQNQTVYTSGGNLMAQNLVNQMSVNVLSGEQNPFRQVGASSRRNASTQAMFIFGRNDERVTFVREVQIPNVP